MRSPRPTRPGRPSADAWTSRCGSGPSWRNGGHRSRWRFDDRLKMRHPPCDGFGKSTGPDLHFEAMRTEDAEVIARWVESREELCFWAGPEAEWPVQASHL